MQLQIAGFDGSTQIPSLAEAFESLSLDVVLPALKTDLLDSAALQSMFLALGRAHIANYI